MVATFSGVSRQHILQAIEEYDSRGADDFLGVYGFGPSRGYELVYEGRTYDSKAILGVAHKFATGRVATSDEFHGGAHGAADILRKKGFVVTEPAGSSSAASAASPAAPRTTRTRTTSPRPTTVRTAARRAAAAADEPARVCPTCFMTLPATGVCDTCG